MTHNLNLGCSARREENAQQKSKYTNALRWG